MAYKTVTDPNARTKLSISPATTNVSTEMRVSSKIQGSFACERQKRPYCDRMIIHEQKVVACLIAEKFGVVCCIADGHDEQRGN